MLASVSIAAAEVARKFRYVVGLLGAALCTVPFYYPAETVSVAFSVVAGLALILLSIRRGTVRETYGTWVSMTK